MEWWNNMNDDLKKILEFVTNNEDHYYSKLTCGEKPQQDLMNTASAVAFQKVRYFIESLIDKNNYENKQESY